MAESDIKIKASHNEMVKQFNESPSKYYYIKSYNGEKNYKGDDDEKIVFDVHIRHNEIGKRRVERTQPYTFETLEEILSKKVKAHEKELEDQETLNKANEKLYSSHKFKNKNYYYEPIVDNKYYISETDCFDIVKKADNGYKVKDEKNNEYFILTYGWQGYYYKDYKAFRNDNEVCYIPEYAYKEDNKSCILVPLDKSNDSIYYRRDILNAVRNELNGKVYADFFVEKAPEKLIESIAEGVLEVVDWQHPESYIYETEWDEIIKDYFSKNEKDKNNYASSELIKELDSGEFSYE